LQTLSHNLDGAVTTNDVSFGFTFTPASQVATRNLSNGSYAFINTPTVSRSYTVNGLNQYTDINSPAMVAPNYDPNGNMTWDGSTTYSYDIENRLTGPPGAARPHFSTFRSVGSSKRIRAGPASHSFCMTAMN
jgi:hypothetical protein